MWQNSKTQNFTTQKLKIGQNLKTQIVTKLKNSNCDQTQKFEMQKNSKTQIVTKLIIIMGLTSNTRILIYLLNYLCNRSGSCDICDSCDRSDSSNSSDQKKTT